MSDEEQPIETTTEIVAKPKRKARRARRKVARPALVQKSVQPDEYAGLTRLDCCTACTLERCVITKTNVCGHPMKSGLQASFYTKPEIVSRYKHAQSVLAHQRIDNAK